MSVTFSQFPPVSECLPQSRYKSLIAAITSIRKKKIKFQYIYRYFKRYNFHVNQLI
ncbi:unnamed protein product, partial [Staurois parvus]